MPVCYYPVMPAHTLLSYRIYSGIFATESAEIPGSILTDCPRMTLLWEDGMTEKKDGMTEKKQQKFLKIKYLLTFFLDMMNYNVYINERELRYEY